MESLILRAREFASLKSDNTQKAYDACLFLLAEFFNTDMQSKEFNDKARKLNLKQATSFLYRLRSRSSDNTMHQRLAVLRRLYRHLTAIGVTESNPFDALSDGVPRRSRKQVRPTKLIPVNKIAEILELPSTATKDGIRDRALLALMFGGGLRRSEIARLNVGDVETTPDGVPYLVLRGTKAGVDQQQSLPEWAWERFSMLVSQRKSEGATICSPLFNFYYVDGTPRDKKNKAGVYLGRLSVETIRRTYREYCEKCGVLNASPHSARATAATVLKSAGYEDRDVAHFLRHNTEEMVRVYDKRARGPAKNCGIKLNFNDENKSLTLSAKRVYKPINLEMPDK